MRELQLAQTGSRRPTAVLTASTPLRLVFRNAQTKPLSIGNWVPTWLPTKTWIFSGNKMQNKPVWILGKQTLSLETTKVLLALQISQNYVPTRFQSISQSKAPEKSSKLVWPRRSSPSEASKKIRAWKGCRVCTLQRLMLRRN